LLANKLRSILTMLGMIIGVGAVIALLSIGQGFEASITDSFNSLGTNLLTIFPGRFDDGQGRQSRSQGQPLTLADAEAITDPFLVPDVEAVAPVYESGAQIVRGQNETFASVTGVTPTYEYVRNHSVIDGNFITDEDVSGRSRIALLGSETAAALFDEYEILGAVGQVIRINDVPFRVGGILEEKGAGFGGNEDSVVLIPLSTAQSRLFSAPAIRGSYMISTIYARVYDESLMDSAADQISEVIRERHRIRFKDDDDFTVLNQADLISVVGDIVAGLTVFLGSIAGISLLVGGIGIMNIMLVSVTERTREIGLRKAIGAKRSDILSQFLIEAIVISIIGGSIGIFLGIATSIIIANVADFDTVVTPSAILLATSFSVGVGLFFGIYPATRAARLSPIAALRYE
jgi:putative ABC transport system permease protein